MKIEKFLAGLAILALLAVSAFALEIISPLAQTYLNSSILLDINSNQSLDNMTYSVDSSPSILMCSNCTEADKVLNLSFGNHTIEVVGSIGNESFADSISFSIGQNLTNGTNQTEQLQVQELNLTIHSPEPKNYTSRKVRFNFSTSMNATIKYSLDGLNYTACSLCTWFSSPVKLRDGQHSLIVNATSGNLSDSEFVSFSVNQTSIFNHNKSANASRFDRGFQNLPKLVEKGQISDAELAEIIRGNRLNPGVINRLLKTSRLGNESLQAILETQFMPKGILKKLLERIVKIQGFDDFEIEIDDGEFKLKIMGKGNKVEIEDDDDENEENHSRKARENDKKAKIEHDEDDDDDGNKGKGKKNKSNGRGNGNGKER
ncbi:hypothetical protein HYT53_03595 [Candidatus Woesearchaeota archaeon]|nr:hypothetical protein [Candidatus Woesearchaeota archaeon]